MQVIDFHGHFFPDDIADKAVSTVADICDGIIKPVLDGRLLSLVSSAKKNSIEKVVTLPVATKVEQVHSINRGLISDSAYIEPFASLHPEMENFAEEIQFIVKSGVKGVKLHPEYQNFYITKSRYEVFFHALEEAGLLVLMHTGYDPGPFTSDHATPEMVAMLLERHPKLRLIAAHLGGLQMWDEVENYLVGKELYLDTAAIAGLISSEQFVRICRAHGCRNILYGSDTPWESQRDSIAFIKESGLSEEEQQLILYKNAKELLGG